MEYKLIKGARSKTRDAAFLFRMGAGFPGDVNRTHPAEIEAALIDVNSPPTMYGQPVLVDATTQGVRPFGAGDQNDTNEVIAFGFTVRPYPTQQATTSQNYAPASFGSATPPISGVMDVLRNGLIMAKINHGSTAPVKGGRVYVWCATTSGNHIQGGLETAFSTGNTVILDGRYTYNGGMDASDVAEVSVNV